MSETNQGNNPDASAIVPLKRKRGRPRKYPRSGLDLAGDSHPPRGHNPNHGESSRVPPGFVGVNGNQPRQVAPVTSVNDATDSMVGQTVHGIIEAAFDAGYLLTVRVDNSETTLRGVVFKAGHYVPVSADNDVAPGVQMIRRNEIPLPRENYAQVHNHNSRSRERNGAVHAARVANPVASKGKQVSSVATESLSSGISRGNLVPVVLQHIDISNGAAGEPSSVAKKPDHTGASKGKQVLDDAHPSNGSAPTNQMQAVQNHLQFQFQNNRHVTQNEAGSAQSLQEVEAKSMKSAGMPFEKLLTEVSKMNQVPTESTETDNSSAGKLSAKDSSIATEDDANDSDQALSVEPLQAVQPYLHNHPTVVSTPLENYRTGKMTELLQVLQDNMTENLAAHAHYATGDPRPKLDAGISQESENGDEDGGHSKKHSPASSV